MGNFIYRTQSLVAVEAFYYIHPLLTFLHFFVSSLCAREKKRKDRRTHRHAIIGFYLAIIATYVSIPHYEDALTYI
jgi:hypothetical protein